MLNVFAVFGYVALYLVIMLVVGRRLFIYIKTHPDTHCYDIVQEFGPGGVAMVAACVWPVSLAILMLFYVFCVMYSIITMGE